LGKRWRLVSIPKGYCRAIKRGALNETQYI
jgi:hypothetical protein